MSEDTMMEPLDLEVDLSNVDTSMPLLPARLHDMVIAEMKKEQNKNQDGYNLVVTFKTTEPCESVQGKPINPGFPLKKYYPLQKSKKEGSTWDFRVPLAQLVDAVYGTSQGDRPGISSEMVGKTVRVSVKVETNDGIQQNAVGNTMHIAD